MKPSLSMVVALTFALLPLSAPPARASAAVAISDAAAAAQDQPQLDASTGFGPLDSTFPTGITPEQIIQKFGAREAAFNDARRSYLYRQTVKVDTLSDDTNQVDGEYQQVTEITFDKKSGQREEHVVFAPQNTLERVSMSPADIHDIEQRLPFVLTTEELPQYNIDYLGRQRVDALDTYVFQASPKVIVKNHRYFQGKVWVDQQDFQIVLVNGKNVPDDKRRGHEDLSPPFTTYYEQIDGKYWFPTYTKAEGVLHFAGGDGYLSNDVHLRTLVRYTDYKRFGTSVKIIYDGQEVADDTKKTGGAVTVDPTGSPNSPPAATPPTPAPPAVAPQPLAAQPATTQPVTTQPPATPAPVPAAAKHARRRHPRK